MQRVTKYIQMGQLRNQACAGSALARGPLLSHGASQESHSPKCPSYNPFIPLRLQPPKPSVSSKHHQRGRSLPMGTPLNGSSSKGIQEALHGVGAHHLERQGNVDSSKDSFWKMCKACRKSGSSFFGPRVTDILRAGEQIGDSMCGLT